MAGEAVGGDGLLAAFAAGLAVTVVNQTLCDCFLDFGQVLAEMTMLLAFVLFGALLSTLLRQVPLLATLAEERAGTAAELFAQSPGDIPRVTPFELADAWPDRNRPSSWMSAAVRNMSATASASPAASGVLPDQVAEWAADRLRDQPFVLYCT